MRRGTAILVALALVATAARAAPSTIPPSDFATFAFKQHLDAVLPLDLILYGADGKPVRFGALFDGRPVLLDFEYDRCTTLCGVMLDQLTAALHALPLKPGRDYRLVAIDIDPEATPQQAADFAKAHGIDGDGPTVLTGDAAAIRRLTEAAGFPSRRDDANRAICPPRRVCRRDAGWHDFALPAWSRLAAARPAARARRGGGRRGCSACPSVVAVLLLLRPADRPL